jgi:hypothetical protein
MAKVNGMKEKLHWPLYDDYNVAAGKALGPGTIPFFVNIQNKTRMGTNMQTSGVLPSQNSYEARALRVVVNGLTVDELTSLIYGSVIRFIVGEKIMVESPTFLFPSGAGVYNPSAIGHGEPNPKEIFSFAEPIFIESHQSFVVELAFPDGPNTSFNVKDNARLWVCLDGYLKRDVL